MARLKIDLVNNVFEVEGEEAFVEKMYKEYKEASLYNTKSEIIKTNNIIKQKTAKETNPVNSNTKLKKSSEKTKKAPNYSINNSLDLKNLRAFYNEKKPNSGFERNLVFVYFLKKELKIDKVDENMIYTCYKFVNIKVPIALRQNLVDTTYNKKWLTMTVADGIGLTIVGENYIEHEMPSTKEK